MGGALPDDDFGSLGATLEGKYIVRSVVAAGGFGVVYLGRHAVLGNELAVKVLKVPPELRDEARDVFVQMFLNEARIVASMKHPAIVRAIDYGVAELPDGRAAPWMVLDWIQGITLAKDLEGRRGAGGRSPEECLAVITPVLEALAEAHEGRVAHRDIKPGNIMIPADSKGRGRRAGRVAPVETRLLDFGIAKVMEGDEQPGSGNTRTSSALPAYSPRYASPEQVSRMRTGPWTDVHALGLVVTEMLLDRPAYTPGDALRLTAQVMADARPTPGRAGVDVGPWEAVLTRALALDPGDRYAHAGELLAALEEGVAGAQAAWSARGTAQVREERAVTEPMVFPPTTPAAPPVVAEPMGAGTLSAVVAGSATGAAAIRRAPRRRWFIAVMLAFGATLAVATLGVWPRERGSSNALPLLRAPADDAGAMSAVRVETPEAAARPVVALGAGDAALVEAPPAAAVAVRVERRVAADAGRVGVRRDGRRRPAGAFAEEAPDFSRPSPLE